VPWLGCHGRRHMREHRKPTNRLGPHVARHHLRSPLNAPRSVLGEHFPGEDHGAIESPGFTAVEG